MGLITDPGTTDINLQKGKVWSGAGQEAWWEVNRGGGGGGGGGYNWGADLALAVAEPLFNKTMKQAMGR